MRDRASGPQTPPEYYEHIARVGRALGSAERLRLLDVLAQGDRTVEILAKTAGQPMRTASHHLQQLKAARLVECRKNGRFAVYSLANESVARFWVELRQFAYGRSLELQAQAADVERTRADGVVMTREEAHRALLSNAAIFMDVRPIEEYRAAHLPGALAVPLDDLVAKIPTLPKGLPIVVYCRGEHCLLADQAVGILRERGFEARRLEDGIIEWRGSGLPTVPDGA